MTIENYDPSILEIWDSTMGKVLRQKIKNSSSKRCYCCKSKSNITIHHIIPKENGGLDTEDNKIKLCKECHLLFHQSRWFENLTNPTDKIFLERLEKLKLFKELAREFGR